MMTFCKNLGIAILIVLTFSSLGFAGFCQLNFSDCGSKVGKLSKIYMNETCIKGNAVLKKGTNVQINFTFEANQDESELKSVVHGALFKPVFIPFPLKNPNACVDSGLTCPIKANTEYRYDSQLSVLSSYPAVSVFVKWELQDKNQADVFCAEIKAQLID